MFESDKIGRLMKIEENEQTRYKFEVWFEYTRQTIMQLKEGVLLAVKNFATNQSETHHTILEVVSIMPIHYALGDKIEGYPGFVMEAARNIATDWTAQENQSQEDTTIIRCVAVPTALEIIESSHGRILTHEQSLPMIGSDVRVLTREASREIVNREIVQDQNDIFEGGKWLVDPLIPIYIHAEDFVRVHFGIFGFTGVGKSNLISTYVSALLQTAQNRNRPIKIVLFDLMGEYTILLLDQLVTLPHGNILGIGEETFPESVVEFLRGNNVKRQQQALNDLLNTCLYPKSLEKKRNTFRPAFELLLKENKIRIYQEPTRTFRDFIRENEGLLIRGNLGGSRNIINTFIDNLRSLGDREISPQQMQDIIRVVDRILNEKVVGVQQKTVTSQDFESYGSTHTSTSQMYNLLSGIQIQREGLTKTAKDNLEDFKRALEAEAEKTRRKISYPENSVLPLSNIIDDLNNQDHSSLFIIQSHNPDNLRKFAYDLGLELFEERRQKGITSPLVSFIFDEADEFIPGQYEKDSSYSSSAWIVEMLARRGRKFGIGIGICTQRTRYLKTSVMAQPHTYLVSKMPRFTDRQAIQEAFGISEEMFRQTFKFAPGDWLLVSYDATGLKAVPIPIHAEDANERIDNFMKNRFGNQRDTR